MINYKALFPNKKIRLTILRFLGFLPDRLMIVLQYYLKTGRFPSLEKPKRYTEKIQWYKLNYRTPLMVQCSDKVGVRDYVQSRGHSSILNEVFEVYRSPEEIDFDRLPDAFVLKYNNGSGVNVFVPNKTEVNPENIRKQLSDLIATCNVKSGREWAYYNVTPRVFAERLYERDVNNDIPDYKFFCFDGRVEYLYVMLGYVDDHAKGQCSFFNRSFEKLEFRRSEYAPIHGDVQKPDNFDTMVQIAESLSAGFPHVRVDLYNLNGKIYFGELTFYPASGYTVFTPDEFDFILGDKFKLPFER